MSEMNLMKIEKMIYVSTYSKISVTNLSQTVGSYLSLLLVSELIRYIPSFNFLNFLTSIDLY